MEGSVILPDKELTIHLNDTSGINLMETIGHGIRYAFDQNDLTLISGEGFIYESCSEGIIKIPLDMDQIVGRHRFYIEAWDGLNNKSTIMLNLEILNNMATNQLLLSKVNPFPNPFSERTHFTIYVYCVL